MALERHIIVQVTGSVLGTEKQGEKQCEHGTEAGGQRGRCSSMATPSTGHLQRPAECSGRGLVQRAPPPFCISDRV